MAPILSLAVILPAKTVCRSGPGGTLLIDFGPYLPAEPRISHAGDAHKNLQKTDLQS
jgi:hypothetical protein